MGGVFWKGEGGTHLFTRQEMNLTTRQPWRLAVALPAEYSTYRIYTLLIKIYRLICLFALTKSTKKKSICTNEWLEDLSQPHSQLNGTK